MKQKCNGCNSEKSVKRMICPEKICPDLVLCNRCQKDILISFKPENHVQCIAIKTANRSQKVKNDLINNNKFFLLSSLNIGNKIHLIFTNGKEYLGKYIDFECYQKIDQNKVASLSFCSKLCKNMKKPLINAPDYFDKIIE